MESPFLRFAYDLIEALPELERFLLRDEPLGAHRQNWGGQRE
jgi:hypothetical protein